jgi:quinol monooxygenase YgiN
LKLLGELARAAVELHRQPDFHAYKENTMSEPIVFISHFRVKQGKFDSLMQLNQKVTEYIEANKPGTVAFLQYLNEQGTELSIIHVFPDADSFDRHIAGADERVKTALEIIEPTHREVYGMPSERVLAMLRPPDDSGIEFQIMPNPAGGYIRFKQG